MSDDNTRRIFNTNYDTRASSSQKRIALESVNVSPGEQFVI